MLWERFQMTGLDQNIKKVLLNNLPELEYNDNQLTLDSYQAVILEV